MVDRAAILKGLERAVISGNRDLALRYAKQVIKEGLDPVEAIDKGLIKGITVIGERYANHQVFLPQMLLASDALYGALDILFPYIPKGEQTKAARVVIGVVEGDVHDIGKNLVKTMLIAAGYRVYDLGKDQPENAFVKGVRKVGAQIVAMSTLMTPTMDSMKCTVDALVEAGLRQELKIIIGGAPTSQEFADEIGADLYGMNANEAVRKLKGSS